LKSGSLNILEPSGLVMRLLYLYLYYIILQFNTTLSYSSFYSKKGKAIPLQAWTGPEGSRKIRIPDLKTIGT